MNKRKLGTEYEKNAAKWLFEQGFTILEMNYRCRTGEIDIIASENGYICFTEVKYRRNSDYGFAGESIDQRKQRIITNTARHYLLVNNYSQDTPARFDTVLIEGTRIELIRNAYGGI